MTPLFPRLHERPEDTARRELTEHRAACDHCPCATGDELARRLGEAVEADLAWTDSTQETR